MVSKTISNQEAGEKLIKYLGHVLKEAPNSFFYKMLRKKNITLNGKKADGTEITKPGDVVCFYLSDETFEKFKGQGTSTKPSEIGKLKSLDYKKYVRVLYEDEDVIFLNKPLGILSQKAESSDVSLNEYYLAFMLDTGRLVPTQFETFKPSVCNRLDRNTTGIVACGKTKAGLQNLSKALKDRTIEKHYTALCKGTISEKIVLEGYMIKDSSTNISYHSETMQEGAYPVKTVIVPKENYKGTTLLDVELITGKSHQIRCHLANIGHPIIGDVKYGDPKVNGYYKENAGVKSQLLHASSVIYEGKTIEAPLPKMFLSAIEVSK